MKYVAIDVGGSHSLLALIHDGEIIASRCLPVDDNSSLAALLPELEDSVNGLLRLGPDCRAVMFSFSGIVDSASRRIVTSNGKYEDGPQINLVEWSRRCFNLELQIENDARAALLGEWVAGAARGCGDVVMVTLGTGVGGAAMIGGRLLRGKHSQAGCLLGHFGANYRGHSCSCGNRGCVEAEASTWALQYLCREHKQFSVSVLAGLPRITFKDLISAANMGDECARAVRDRCIEVWATAAVSWIHAYDPEVIVFGGGIMETGSELLPAIERYVDSCAWTPCGRVSVRKAELGNRAALFAGMAVFDDRNEEYIR